MVGVNRVDLNLDRMGLGAYQDTAGDEGRQYCSLNAELIRSADVRTVITPHVKYQRNLLILTWLMAGACHLARNVYQACGAIAKNVIKRSSLSSGERRCWNSCNLLSRISAAIPSDWDFGCETPGD